MRHPKPFFAAAAVVALSLASCGNDSSSTESTDSAVVTVVDTTTPVVTTTVVDTVVEVDDVVRISVTVGDDSDPGRIEEVRIGQQVELTLVNPDEDDEFHLHGYDLGGEETPAGEEKTFAFTATEAGDFEVESHVTNAVLVVIRVS